MSGLVLFAAFVAVVIFVVAIKYTSTLILGIPSGEFTVMCMVMILMVVMLAFYVRRLEPARNVLLWFAATGIIEAILSNWNLHVNGYVYSCLL